MHDFNLDFHSAIISARSPREDWSNRIKAVFGGFVRNSSLPGTFQAHLA